MCGLLVEIATLYALEGDPRQCDAIRHGQVERGETHALDLVSGFRNIPEQSFPRLSRVMRGGQARPGQGRIPSDSHMERRHFMKRTQLTG